MSAAEVFKHLNAHEVKQISASMVNMAGFTHDQMAMVLEEFKKDSSEYAALSLNTNDYLRSVLVKALGEERASSLLEDLLDTHQGTNGIETLNFMDPQAVFDLIREEHPQIIATILVHLKRNRAADVLGKFDERERNDIMLRIATFGGVQPAALQELTEVLNNLLHGQNLKRSKMGGVRPAAEILNLMKSHRKRLPLRRYVSSTASWRKNYRRDVPVRKPGGGGRPQHPAPAAGDRERNADHRTERGRRAAAHEVLPQYVAPSGELMTDDLASRGPVRLSQVEAEQKTILNVVRRLAETGGS